MCTGWAALGDPDELWHGARGGGDGERGGGGERGGERTHLLKGTR